MPFIMHHSKAYLRRRRWERLGWGVLILALLLGVGSCMNCGLRQHAEYEAWEKAITPGENVRIDILMRQIGEGAFGDALLMRDGSVQMLWNYQPLNTGERDTLFDGNQGVNSCPGVGYECRMGNMSTREWDRRDFSEVERFVKKNPDDPEWNRLAGKFLLQ